MINRRKMTAISLITLTIFTSCASLFIDQRAIELEKSKDEYNKQINRLLIQQIGKMTYETAIANFGKPESTGENEKSLNASWLFVRETKGLEEVSNMYGRHVISQKINDLRLILFFDKKTKLMCGYKLINDLGR